MHNSQSSDSAAEADVPRAPTTDPDPVLPPTSPPNDQIPSPSPMPSQPMQQPQSDRDDQSPASPQLPAESSPKQRQNPSAEPVRNTSVTPPNASAPPSARQQPKVDNMSPTSAAQARRTPRQRGRPGRPPNTNENSLLRRLECVMAVESGRMTMLTACQQYEISARTFYRWLRNKDRLIELTGFCEDDFKDGNPPVTKQTLEMQESARMPPTQRNEPDSNLPRLPNQPASAPNEPPSREIQPAPPTPAQPFAASKRRLPKSNEQSREYPTYVMERFSSPYGTYYRQNFSKKTSQAQHGREQGSGPSERQAAARNATRMRRESWQANQSVEYVRTDERGFPIPYSDTPPETYKRRKMTRAENIPPPDEPGQAGMLSPSRDRPGDDRSIEDAPFVNGNAGPHPDVVEHVHMPRDGIPPDAPVHGKTVLVNGPPPMHRVMLSEAVYDPRIPRKHRIEIMMGRRKVTLAWYDGTAANDIKVAIARRFALLPETQWALVDREYDEIIISDGIPSGRYTLTVLS